MPSAPLGKTISIHAPLRERQQPQMFPTQMSDFNPRSLTGATTTLVVKTRSSGFQSTLPYGSEHPASHFVNTFRISIHAPLRERTFAQIIISREGNFNPRSLTGATVSDEILRTSLGFQSTLPYGSEEFADLPSSVRAISIHAPLRERLPYGSEASKQITSLLI